MKFRISSYYFMFYLLLVLSALLNSGCGKGHPDDAVLHGTLAVNSITGVELYRIEPDSSVLIYETKTNRKGEFSIQWNPGNYGVFLLKAGNTPKATLIVTKKEKIHLKEEKKPDYSTFHITGSENSEIFQQYLLIENQTLQLVDSLENQFRSGQSKPDFFMIRQQIDSAYSAVMDAHKMKTLDFIREHKFSLASALILSRAPGGTPLFSLPADLPVFMSIDSSLQSRYAQNSHYKFFHQRVSEYQDPDVLQDIKEIGRKVPDFQLPDIAGTTRSLHSIKGKVRLILFWTSWNPECRRMNVSLAGIDNEFRNKGLKIISVSFDTDPEAWKDAVRKDKAYWIQLHDSNALNSEIIKEFGIRKFPTIAVVNSQGILLHKTTGITGLRTLIRNYLAGS